MRHSVHRVVLKAFSMLARFTEFGTNIRDWKSST
jgi:hypothetical protein